MCVSVEVLTYGNTMTSWNTTHIGRVWIYPCCFPDVAYKVRPTDPGAFSSLPGTTGVSIMVSPVHICYRCRTHIDVAGDGMPLPINHLSKWPVCMTADHCPAISAKCPRPLGQSRTVSAGVTIVRGDTPRSTGQ